MKRLLLAGAAAGLLALGAPAQAHPDYHYAGGCGFTPVSGGVEDGDTTWTAVVTLLVHATSAQGGPPPPGGGAIYAACDVYVNGVFRGTALEASGDGIAFAATQWVYRARPDHVITLCDRVTVDGEQHMNCNGAATTP